MVDRITLPGRTSAPRRRVDPELAAAAAYGKNYFLKPLESRTPDQQHLLEQRISAFHNWRRQEGESLTDGDVWEVPPPEASVVRRYIIKMSFCYPHHRYQVHAALRCYFFRWKRPDLFKIVETPKI